MGKELELRESGERSLELQLGALGGFDLRPTRLFVWKGEEREAQARIVSLGFPPGNAGSDVTPHEVEAGAVRVRTRGNPLLTVALAGVYATRRAVEAAKRPPTGS
jgi:hypothetical protein